MKHLILPLFLCFTASHLTTILYFHQLKPPPLNTDKEPPIRFLYPDYTYPIIIPDDEPSLQKLLILAGKKYRISPLLLEAVIKAESDFNPLAERFEHKHQASSVGLMQVMTFNATPHPCNLNHHSELFVPSKNIDCGSALLRQALNSTKSLHEALIAYNGGLGCLKSPKCRIQGTIHANKVLKHLSKSIIKNSQ